MNELEFARNYFETVLGIGFAPVLASPRARFYVIDLPSPGGLKDNEMFQKMMAALGMDLGEIEVVECLVSEISHFRERFDPSIPVLSFAPELSEALRDSPPVMTLKGPRDLASEPSAKRETWHGLQSFLKSLSS